MLTNMPDDRLKQLDEALTSLAWDALKVTPREGVVRDEDIVYSFLEQLDDVYGLVERWREYCACPDKDDPIQEGLMHALSDVTKVLDIE